MLVCKEQDHFLILEKSLKSFVFNPYCGGTIFFKLHLYCVLSLLFLILLRSFLLFELIVPKLAEITLILLSLVFKQKFLSVS